MASLIRALHITSFFPGRIVGSDQPSKAKPVISVHCVTVYARWDIVESFSTSFFVDATRPRPRRLDSRTSLASADRRIRFGSLLCVRFYPDPDPLVSLIQDR
jgi:hypothetical protein